ncbi:uncharacterized protein METZ01_LOCUS485145, partial [marine metagenome]
MTDLNNQINIDEVININIKAYEHLFKIENYLRAIIINT